MEIHKPKAAHSWREFLIEIGTIICGILIALALEQLVETLHWRHELDGERRALLQEAADSMDGVAQRQAQQACVDRRLAEVRDVLERHRRGEPIKLTGRIGFPVVQGASRGSWQIAMADQALSHMSHSEKLLYSDVFAIFDLWDRARESERQSWYKLSALNTPDLLGENEWGSVAATYNEAVMINDGVRALAPFVLKKKLPALERYRVAAADLSGFRQIRAEICQRILPTIR